MKLNNLLTFKEFGEFPKKKKTKRTDTGIDILNESFYDKFTFKINNDRPLEDSIKEFSKRIVKAANSGQISDLNIDDNVYTFKILNRDFKIDCNNDPCMAYMSTNITRSNTKIDDWVEFTLPSEYVDDIKDALGDIDYL